MIVICDDFKGTFLLLYCVGVGGGRGGGDNDNEVRGSRSARSGRRDDPRRHTLSGADQHYPSGMSVQQGGPLSRTMDLEVITINYIIKTTLRTTPNILSITYIQPSSPAPLSQPKRYGITTVMFIFKLYIKSSLLLNAHVICVFIDDGIYMKIFCIFSARKLSTDLHISITHIFLSIFSFIFFCK